MILLHKIKHQLALWVLSISATLLPTAAIAAERITFNITPFGQFEIKVQDLETYLNTGRKTSELNYYLQRLSPEQLKTLPKLLATPLKFKPLTVAKFSNSEVGEMVIKNFGKGIRSEVDHNGFYALRSAIIGAAFDKQGLTLINLLRYYPLKTVHLDLKVISEYRELGEKLAKDRAVINRLWFTKYQNRGLKQNLPQTDRELALSIPGQYSWQMRTLSYYNPHRHETGLFDLYQPQVNHPHRPFPVIAISHGMASSRQTFAYLAKHLASHGFAVAVIEHNEMSLAKFDRILSGQDSFPKVNNLINQPLDISYVLDRLEAQPNLDLKRVGLVGQSFGGYSALALAGGNLIPETTAKECQTEDYQAVLLDLSSLAKCTLNQFQHSPVHLKDPRVKAVIVINPMAKIFGEEGMSQINTPTMIISGTNDLVMPPVAEQIEPFSWLKEDHKYLVMAKPGTHFSFLQEGLGVLPVPDDVVGPRPIYAYPALKILSTAFFQVYLGQKSESQNYLQSDRVTQLNNHAFEFSLIDDVTEQELEQFK